MSSGARAPPKRGAGHPTQVSQVSGRAAVAKAGSASKSGAKTCAPASPVADHSLPSEGGATEGHGGEVRGDRHAPSAPSTVTPTDLPAPAVPDDKRALETAPPGVGSVVHRFRGKRQTGQMQQPYSPSSRVGRRESSLEGVSGPSRESGLSRKLSQESDTSAKSGSQPSPVAHRARGPQSPSKKRRGRRPLTRPEPFSFSTDARKSKRHATAAEEDSVEEAPRRPKLRFPLRTPVAVGASRPRFASGPSAGASSATGRALDQIVQSSHPAPAVCRTTMAARLKQGQKQQIQTPSVVGPISQDSIYAFRELGENEAPAGSASSSSCTPSTVATLTACSNAGSILRSRTSMTTQGDLPAQQLVRAQIGATLDEKERKVNICTDQNVEVQYTVPEPHAFATKRTARRVFGGELQAHMLSSSSSAPGGTSSGAVRLYAGAHPLPGRLVQNCSFDRLPNVHQATGPGVVEPTVIPGSARPGVRDLLASPLPLRQDSLNDFS